MKIRPCPTEQLPSLIRDDLSSPVTEQIQAHLETCVSCQRQLEALVGDPTWWKRVTHSLSDDASQSDRDWSNSSDTIIAQIDSLPRSGITERTSAALLDAPSHPEMLGRIDQFDVEEKIGQGGMGVVFRGFDSALNRPVAIKILAPHLSTNGVARKRFAREAQAAAAVVHPNVVPIYSVKDSHERPYIVMALVDGRSLQEHVTHNGPVETKDIVRIAHQIAAGLAAAHQQGLIHRDIKPANILLEKDVSRVMITDFGLARAADDAAMTRTGWLAGTPHYMSPEQTQGLDVDRRSDLFSLGSTLYFMATGREPFRAETPFAVLEQIKHEHPVPARSINSQIPQTLDRIIHRLLEKEPDDRIESADELEQMLARYLAHLQHPQSNAEPKLGPRPSRLRRLKKITIGTTIAISTLLAMRTLWPIPQPAPTGLSNHATHAGDSNEWKRGLQPLSQWTKEANQLERDLWNLEQQLGPRNVVDIGADATWQNHELQLLSQQIESMRQTLPELPESRPQSKGNRQ